MINTTAVDIVDFVSQYVELTEKNGEFWGLSPFKDEKTPSFSVRRETNSFYDFSSGIGGNTYTFIKYYNKCSNKEAVEILKKYAGCAELSPMSAKLSATSICKKYLPKIKQKKSAENTVFADNYMQRYEKRSDKLAVWEAEGISREVLDEYQVYYDAFSDRLVYPIRNAEGKIVNIGGRTLDPDWKEKKLRKYTYFSGWGELDVIYGLFENMQAVLLAREIIIFEGCKSVMLSKTWGISNTGALLTSHLNPRQMKLLARLGVRAVFALDKEVNIKKDHNIDRLKQYVNVYYLCDKHNLLDDKDSPVDKGKEIFKQLYDEKIKLK